VRFIDAPALAEVFQGFGTYEVCSSAELGVPLKPEACTQLGEAELEQVQYWRPHRVGDLVFNFWD
jgi:hypothetical protein